MAQTVARERWGRDRPFTRPLPVHPLSLRPLGLKEPLIPAHEGSEVYTAGLERLAAEVMNESVLGNHGPVARPQGSQAVIIILITTHPEAFVQEPNLLDHLPPDQQAEADQ